MITLLAKIFVKSELKDEAVIRKKYGTLCGVVGIILNIFLFGFKYLAGAISGSVAIMADAFNNLSDAGSSFITLIGFVFAGKKPNPEHPFGHGRFEYISGFIVSMLIILMGVELFTTSIDKVFHPQEIDGSMVTIIILIVAILVKVYMAFYNSAVGKKIDSAALKATAADSLGDTVSTTVVLVSILVSKFFELNIDGFCGVGVAIFIFIAGVNAAKDTMTPLLGQAPDPEFVKSIEEIVLSHDMAKGIHDLVVHDYGPGRVMISLHVEVPGNEDIFEIHDVIDIIEYELKLKLKCEATIHMDPIVVDDEHVINTKKLIVEKLESEFGDLKLHDFRMVEGPTHTNLMFDVVRPFSNKLTDEEFKLEIRKRVKEVDDKYEIVIKIDNDYVGV